MTDSAPAGEATALNGTTEAEDARGAAPALAGEARSAAGTTAGTGQPASDARGGLQDDSGLAVIAELADDVRISRTTAGISVCMSWPSSAR